jgi:hypothetical protein
LREQHVNSTAPASSAHSPISAQRRAEDDYWDALDAKAVFYPADGSGELAMSLRIPSAFENAGYQIRQWGRAEFHPVWVLRARNKTAPRFGKRDPQFIQHVLQILRSADVNARKADLVVDRTGDRILVSFLWPLAVRAWRFDEEHGWAPDPFAT